MHLRSKYTTSPSHSDERPALNSLQRSAGNRDYNVYIWRLNWNENESRGATNPPTTDRSGVPMILQIPAGTLRNEIFKVALFR